MQYKSSESQTQTVELITGSRSSNIVAIIPTYLTFSRDKMRQFLEMISTTAPVLICFRMVVGNPSAWWWLQPHELLHLGDLCVQHQVDAWLLLSPASNLQIVSFLPYHWLWSFASIQQFAATYNVITYWVSWLTNITYKAITYKTKTPIFRFRYSKVKLYSANQVEWIKSPKLAMLNKPS